MWLCAVFCNDVTEYVACHVIKMAGNAKRRAKDATMANKVMLKCNSRIKHAFYKQTQLAASTYDIKQVYCNGMFKVTAGYKHRYKQNSSSVTRQADLYA